MRDYADLNEDLRYCASEETACIKCKHWGKSTCANELCGKAADAIEELLADNTEAFSADFISMQNAVETDVWLMVWAAEPNRKIHVQMTYDELWKIVQRERENMIEPPKGVSEDA